VIYATDRATATATATSVWLCVVGGAYCSTLVATSALANVIALAQSGSTLYMATSAAIAYVATACSAPCMPTTIATAATNTEYRGLALAPQALPSPSPSPSPSTSPTPSLSTGASPSATAAPLPFSAGNIVALRVGAVGGAALSANYAPVFLDQFSTAAASAPVSSTPVQGVTLSGTDRLVGSLSRSTDMSSLYFGGMAAPVGSTVTITSPYGTNARALARVNIAGSVAVTTIASSAYNGVIWAACGPSAAGAWIIGNSSTVAVGFVADGVADSVATQMTVTSAGAAYSGCGVGSSGSLFLLLPLSPFCYLDRVASPATSGTMTTASDSNFNSGPYLAKTVITNAAETRIWIGLSDGQTADVGIFTGTSATSTTFAQMLSPIYLVTGLALSSDEGTLFFATLTALYSVSATCTSACAATLYTRPRQTPTFAGSRPLRSCLHRRRPRPLSRRLCR
jgi:hypothetical protein